MMQYRKRPAWRNQWVGILMGVLVCLVFLMAFVLGQIVTDRGKDSFLLIIAAGLLPVLLIPILYRKYAWLYTIDSENIESSHGIISRDLNAIRIKDVRNINVRQTVMQRLLSIGDVEFSSAGGGDVEVIFYGVPAPVVLKDRVQDLQDHTDSVD